MRDEVLFDGMVDGCLPLVGVLVKLDSFLFVCSSVLFFQLVELFVVLGNIPGGSQM